MAVDTGRIADPVHTQIRPIGDPAEGIGGFRVGLGDASDVRSRRIGTAVKTPHLVRFVQRPVASDPVEERAGLVDPDKTVTFAILPADDKTIPEMQCEDSAGNPYRRRMQRLGIDGEYDRYKAGMDRPLADGTPITSQLIPMQASTAEALIAERIQTYEQIAMTSDEELLRILGPDVSERVKEAAARFVSKSARESERQAFARELEREKKLRVNAETLREQERKESEARFEALETRLKQFEAREGARDNGLATPSDSHLPATAAPTVRSGGRRKATRKKATRKPPAGPAPPGGALDDHFSASGGEGPDPVPDA